MDIMNLLTQMGGLSSMAKELGISENQAKSGAEALMPALLGGFKKQTQAHPSGLQGLGGLLGQLGGGGLLDDVLSPHQTNVNRGNGVLGQIFGSKDISRTVAMDAAAKSGLSEGILKKMLPILAMMVTGFMAKGGAGQVQQQSSASGGLGGLIGNLVGGLTGGTAESAGSASSGLASMLDLDGDGNPLDEILQMAGKALR